MSPNVAARVAGRLFCRPTRHKRPAAERDWLLTGDPFPVRLGRRSLRAWRWGEGDKTVFLMHGWSGRGSQLGAFIEPLLERGYSVVTWDGPGHGDSPGKSSSLVEIADALWAVSRTLRRVPHGIIGHSMGAGAGGVAVAEGLGIERAVWVAPPASLTYFVGEFADWLGFEGRARAAITEHMEARFQVDLSSFDVERVTADGVPGDRMLVIHDQGDREVPIRHGERVFAALGGAHFMETRGLGHRRVLKDRDVVRAAVDWIDGVERESSAA